MWMQTYQTKNICKLKSNSTHTTEFYSKIQRIATTIRKMQCITEKSIEQMNNEAMEKCSGISSHLQGKMTIVKELRLLKILRTMYPLYAYSGARLFNNPERKSHRPAQRGG
jgi:aromatic ring hydroxylase